jgi:L-threonylcarbamoyladenylate synthase
MTSEDRAVRDAARAALEGRLIVLPTDTVYGIGTRPDDAAAVARVFTAKARPRELALPVLAASAEDAAAIAAFDDRAERLARELWPGAATFILPRTRRSADWDLGGDGSTIGVRVPAHPLALAVLRRAGPLAMTSANRSGDATPVDCDGVRSTFGDEVRVYVCDERSHADRPSTVIDLTQDAPRVLREGELDQGALDALLIERR